ncbi:MAG TPA: vWA domain-containing protein [Gemmatimonadaceae bacterium]
MSTATLINVILDQSGSMELKKGDVIGGFNRFLDEQKAQPGECRLSLVTFNTEKTVIHAALPIADVPPLTAATYAPGGMTALLDALAEGVRLADKHKQAAERVLCLVITDGEENSSRETTLVQAREIIKAREALGDWTFTYLGISPEKWADCGLTRSVQNAATWDAADPATSFAAMSYATKQFRGSTAGQTLSFYEGVKQGPEPKPAPVTPSRWLKPHR